MTKNEVFISKAKAVHGDTYDYSKVDYTTNVKPITIICKIHGEYTQRPTDHLAGSGCKICGRKRSEDAKRKTNVDFVTKAKLIHGDKYDYTNTVYTQSTNNVTINCKVHGPFSQIASNHLSGYGCPSCKTDNRKSTLNDFITKAKAKHGDKYDYSKVNYINNREKVIIGCPMHGDFSQAPVNHLNYGCSICGGVKKKTTEDFVKESIKTHGDAYDYSKSNYDGNKKQVIIICKKHGTFLQSPNAHISKKQGCPKCNFEKLQESNKLTLYDFITKARALNNDFYNYDKVKYISSNSKVTITCPLHGDFDQTANNHLQGHGCPTCGKEESIEKSKSDKCDFITRAELQHGKVFSYDRIPERIKLSDKYEIYCRECGEYFQQKLTKHLLGQGHKECSKKMMTTEEYIQKAKSVHGDKYDYSLVEYKGGRFNIMIICPVHGEFSQNASGHLAGSGCFKCGREIAINKTRTSISDFISKANKIHNNKYDYSLVNFNNVNDEIKILCPRHGLITQRLSGHLKYGCELCHYDTKRMTHDEFIKKAQERHGEEYDYSKTIFKGNDVHVDIICRKHGVFSQKATEHIRLRGCGCPVCVSSKGEKKIADILKELNVDYKREYKIDGFNYRYDFKILNNDILIEFDGEQHYISIEKWGGDERLSKQKIDDQIKNSIAIIHKYDLIRIPYFKYDELEEYLITTLSKIYPYFYKGVFYKGFKQLLESIGKTIDTESREEYEKYHTIKLLKK